MSSSNEQVHCFINTTFLCCRFALNGWNETEQNHKEVNNTSKFSFRESKEINSERLLSGFHAVIYKWFNVSFPVLLTLYQEPLNSPPTCCENRNTRCHCDFNLFITEPDSVSSFKHMLRFTEKDQKLRIIFDPSLPDVSND